jgi:hypothetical protein
VVAACLGSECTGKKGLLLTNRLHKSNSTLNQPDHTGASELLDPCCIVSHLREDLDRVLS